MLSWVMECVVHGEPPQRRFRICATRRHAHTTAKNGSWNRNPRSIIETGPGGKAQSLPVFIGDPGTAVRIHSRLENSEKLGLTLAERSGDASVPTLFAAAIRNKEAASGGPSSVLAVQRIHAHKRYRGRHVSFVEHPPLSPFKGGLLLWCYSHRRPVERGAFMVPF